MCSLARRARKADMAATNWIGTPKALYRMALRGGDDWNRLKDGLRANQREELDRLAQSAKTLGEELSDAKEAEERKGAGRRLRKPWEEARQIALDPPEAFVLAKALVDIAQAEPRAEIPHQGARGAIAMST